MKIFQGVKKFWSGLVGDAGRAMQYFLHSHHLGGIGQMEDYSSWAYASITVIANRISGLTRHLENTKGEQVVSKLSNLVTTEIIQYIAISLKMYGEAYIYKFRIPGKKEIIALRYINVHQIQPIIVNGFQKGRRINGDLIVEKDDVITLRYANPNNKYGAFPTGYSPLMAAKKSLQIERSMEERNNSLVLNGAKPGTVIYVGGEPTKDQIERMTEMFDDTYRGVSNHGKTLVISEDMKIESQSMLSQKDMEYIDGIKWSMEKVLAIFQVPKAMLGMGEGVNVGNVKAFEGIFARNVIQPLCQIIQESLTKQLFNGEIMYFDGVIPVDDEQVRSNYILGGITRNEMRLALGYDEVEGGDTFYDGLYAVREEPQKTGVDIGTAITKGLRSVVKGTEEYKEKRRSDGVKRQDNFIPELSIALKKVFKHQEKEVLEEIKDEKSLKLTVPGLGNRYQQLYLSLVTPPLRRFMKNEGQIAIEEVIDGVSFSIDTEAMKTMQRKQILTIAQSVDTVTDKKIKEVISNSLSNGLTPHETRQALKEVFKDLTTHRLDTIVRTEATRAATFSQMQARKQSDVVSLKERYTSVDERTCPHCEAMHGKKIGLEDTYFQKGDVMVGTNGKPLRLDYDDTNGPALHPNCRCTLLPVVD